MTAPGAQTSRHQRSALALALGLVILVGALAAAGGSAQGQAPKRGGILTSMIIEDPPGFSVHESATVSTVPHHSLYNWGRMQEVWLDK